MPPKAGAPKAARLAEGGGSSQATDYSEPQGGPPPGVHVVSRRSVGNLQPEQAVPQVNKEVDTLVSDLEADLGGEEEPASGEQPTPTPATEEPADELKKIVETYKTPEAMAKQVYNAELQRRRAQSERDMLVKSIQDKPAAVPVTTTPASQRVDIRPWDKGKANDTLEGLGDHMEEFGQTLLMQVFDRMAPLYDISYRIILQDEYPGLVTKDTLPVIAALAKAQEGQTVMEKLRKAADQYKQTYGMPKAATEEKPAGDQRTATETPEPRIRSRTPPTYTRAQIQYLSSYKPEEYQRLLPKIERAYKEGRVKEA